MHWQVRTPSLWRPDGITADDGRGRANAAQLIPTGKAKVTVGRQVGWIDWFALGGRSRLFGLDGPTRLQFQQRYSIAPPDQIGGEKIGVTDKIRDESFGGFIVDLMG